jgi:hypothetical protein
MGGVRTGAGDDGYDGFMRPKRVVLATIPVKLVPMMLSITAGAPG